MAGDLPGGLVALLHARAHEDAAASRGGHGRADGQPRQGPVDILDDGSPRKCASACRAASSVSSILRAPPGLPRENPWSSGRASWETFSKHAIFAGATGRLLLTAIAIARSPGARNYMDQALTPVGDDDDETLDLFTKTAGGGARRSRQEDRQANWRPPGRLTPRQAAVVLCRNNRRSRNAPALLCRFRVKGRHR